MSSEKLNLFWQRLLFKKVEKQPNDPVVSTPTDTTIIPEPPEQPSPIQQLETQYNSISTSTQELPRTLDAICKKLHFLEILFLELKVSMLSNLKDLDNEAADSVEESQKIKTLISLHVTITLQLVSAYINIKSPDKPLLVTPSFSTHAIEGSDDKKIYDKFYELFDHLFNNDEIKNLLNKLNSDPHELNSAKSRFVEWILIHDPDAIFSGTKLINAQIDEDCTLFQTATTPSDYEIDNSYKVENNDSILAIKKVLTYIKLFQKLLNDRHRYSHLHDDLLSLATTARNLSQLVNEAKEKLIEKSATIDGDVTKKLINELVGILVLIQLTSFNNGVVMKSFNNLNNPIDELATSLKDLIKTLKSNNDISDLIDGWYRAFEGGEASINTHIKNLGLTFPNFVSFNNKVNAVASMANLEPSEPSNQPPTNLRAAKTILWDCISFNRVDSLDFFLKSGDDWFKLSKNLDFNPPTLFIGHISFFKKLFRIMNDMTKINEVVSNMSLPLLHYLIKNFDQFAQIEVLKSNNFEELLARKWLESVRQNEAFLNLQKAINDSKSPSDLKSQLTPISIDHSLLKPEAYAFCRRCLKANFINPWLDLLTKVMTADLKTEGVYNQNLEKAVIIDSFFDKKSLYSLIDLTDLISLMNGKNVHPTIRNNSLCLTDYIRKKLVETDNNRGFLTLLGSMGIDDALNFIIELHNKNIINNYFALELIINYIDIKVNNSHLINTINQLVANLIISAKIENKLPELIAFFTKINQIYTYLHKQNIDNLL